MRPEPAAHALLRIAADAPLECAGAAPEWMAPSLARAPWVVVRRAAARDGLIPVGVRGARRAQRLAAWLDPGAVLERVTPPELAARRAWADRPRSTRLAPLMALAAVERLMRAQRLSWGPCGSVGFELASSVPTVTADSDLDLMVQAREPLPVAAAMTLLAGCRALPVRIDVQLEGPHGAVALSEYALGRTPLVLRTLAGPRLVRDPWTAAPAAA